MSDMKSLPEDFIDRMVREAVERTAFELDSKAEMALWAAGWRKRPSREILARELYVSDNAGVEDAGSHWDHGTVREWTIERMYRQADAILALMDGPTETGEK